MTCSQLRTKTRTSISLRFPANSSHMFCVELALKGLASVGKGLCKRVFPGH